MDSPMRMWQRLRADPRRRDAVDATGLAVLGLFLTWAGMVDTNSTGWALPRELTGPWWHAVPLAIGCLLVLGRRRRPLTMVVAVLPVVALDVWLGGSIAMYVVLFDLVYSAILHTTNRRVRTVVVIVAVLVAGSTGAVFVASGDTRAAFLVGLQVFALLGTPVWWGISVRQQAELAALASARADDLQRLAELREQQAVRDERTRMARDLHDALSSHLSTVAIHSSAALADAAERPPGDRRQEALGAIRKASVSALEDLREMILLLQTGADPVASAAHLSEVDDLVTSARATGLDVELRGDPTSLPRLAATVDHAAYRIVQESLTNAAKHAPGSRVVLSVRLDRSPESEPDPGALLLQVASRPPEPALPANGSGTGLGLVTMHERATAVGGSLTAGWSEDRDGMQWVVTARLPLAAAGHR